MSDYAYERIHAESLQHTTWTIKTSDWEQTCFSMTEVTELMTEAANEQLSCTVTQCPF